MKIEKTLSYKELKQLTKVDDYIFKNVVEVRVKASTSERSMYARVHDFNGNKVKIWRGVENGLWLWCGEVSSIFFTRGFVTLTIEVNENENN